MQIIIFQVRVYPSSFESDMASINAWLSEGGKEIVGTPHVCQTSSHAGDTKLTVTYHYNNSSSR